MLSKKTIKYILLTFSIIVILLGLFYLYNYLNGSLNEGFATPDLPGVPYDNHDITGPNTEYIPTSVPISNLISSPSALFAIDVDTNIYQYLISSKQWDVLPIVKGQAAANQKAISLLTPTPTNPIFETDTTSDSVCKGRKPNLCSVSRKALWLYNSTFNSRDRVDCLYYTKLGSNGFIPLSGATFQCLQLPKKDVVVPSTTQANTKPAQNFDNLRLIAANDNILFAMGCGYADDKLYYCILNSDGVPASANEDNWKVCPLPTGVARNDISNICVNDACVFFNFINSDNNGIYYSPISVSSGTLTPSWKIMIDRSKLPLSDSTTNVDYDSLTVNNDIIWFKITTGFSIRTELWYCPLKDKMPLENDPVYKWDKITVKYRGSDANIGFNKLVMYNNKLILANFGNIGYNTVINIKPSTIVFSSPTAGSSTPTTTIPTTTGTGTTTTIPTPTGTGTTTTIPTTTGTGTTTTTPTTTRPTPSGTGISATVPGLPTIAGAGGAGGAGYESIVRNMFPGIGIGSDMNDLDLSKFLYMSPMGDNGYNVSTSKNGKNKISSYYFPIVKMN